MREVASELAASQRRAERSSWNTSRDSCGTSAATVGRTRGSRAVPLVVVCGVVHEQHQAVTSRVMRAAAAVDMHHTAVSRCVPRASLAATVWGARVGREQYRPLVVVCGVQGVS